MTETREYLIGELKKVEAWEKDQGDLWFWEKIARIPFKILDKWTPAFIQNKISLLLDEVGQYLQTGGSYLSSVASVKKYYSKHHINNLEEVSLLPLTEMDQAVRKLSKNRKIFATLQGASTGFGGIFTLSLDIPLLLGTQLKTLQDTAICYGYNPNEKKERLFIIKCLQFVSSDIVGKKAVLQFISKYEVKNEQMQRQVVSEIQGWREVVLAYREQFGWKKLFQMVPVVGFIFGASVNRGAIHDLAEAGMMLYRKRRILEKIKQQETEGLES
ncbi:EcsC family protein [Bacillaceae bacterium Marseille-Q3522]|nr:EcsC family protein [Bacillaceae bacterium Marseille-Q3522]